MSRAATPAAGTGPHVLILPSWYPTEMSPLSGIFFREQAHALRVYGGARVGVIAPILRGVRTVGEGRIGAYLMRTAPDDDGGVATLRAQGWSVPKMERANQWLWMRLARRLARQYARRFGAPDVVHAHGAVWAALPACRVAAEWGVPAVVTEHTSSFAEGALSAGQMAWARAGFEGAARVVAVSRALRRDIEPLTGATPVEVVPNLVDTAFFTLPPAPRATAGEFRFLAVALFLPVKRMDLLVRAFASAFRGHAGVRLEIAGGGEGEGEIRRLAGELGIGAQVEWSGMLSRPQVRDAMWRCHALVLSSDVETFGVAPIEAMATGLPVVSTACGGPADTIVPGETGTLTPVGDAGALAAAMRGVHQERSAWEARAGRIRDHAERNFSQPVVVRQLLRVYAAARL